MTGYEKHRAVSYALHVLETLGFGDTEVYDALCECGEKSWHSLTPDEQQRLREFAAALSHGDAV